MNRGFSQKKYIYQPNRSSAGLILTEASPISQRSGAFPGAGGIYDDSHIAGWKKVIDAVHKKDCKIAIQIFHSGRATHSSQQGGLVPWAPSAIPIRTPVHHCKLPHEIPHVMTIPEIKSVVKEFRLAAERSLKAGFDGAVLHGAHGYLVDQFLKSSSNQRTDEYGGSIENRSRFCLEVIDEFISVFGADRVGIKVTPAGHFSDVNDNDPISLYTYLFKELSKRKISFIELKRDLEPENFLGYGYPASLKLIPDVYKQLRPIFKGAVVANNEFTPETAEEGIKKGDFDAVSFGRYFINNPDFVERVQNGWELNRELNFGILYSPGPKGYIDYPTYHEWKKQQKK